jgi:GNAT superfamily N-acetyltransferase
MPAIVRSATIDDADAIANVHATAWREAYAGLVPTDLLTRPSLEERAAFWRHTLGAPDGGTAAFIALDRSGRMLAFGSCGPQRSPDLAAAGFAGDFHAVYVLTRAQRRGVGRRLMAAMAHEMLGRGYGGASLWVLRTNLPARRFYDALGGIPVGEREQRHGKTVLVEVAYGWTALDKLAETLAQ